MPEVGNRIFTKSYFVAIGICLCFLIGGLLFSAHIMRLNENENIHYLYDGATQHRLAIERQVGSDFHTLRGIATVIGMADLDDPVLLESILQEISAHNDFLRMGLADLQGRAVLLDTNGAVYRDIDVSAEPFFLKALSGQEAISDMRRDIYTGQNVIYYALPLLREGEMTGVLCALSAVDELAETVNVPVWNGKGYSQIVDSAGRLIFRSTHKQVDAKAATVGDLGEFTPEEYDRVLSFLTQRRQNTFSFVSDGKTQLAVLEPIGLNDWFVLTVLPQEAVRQYLNQAAVGTTAILVIAFAIFLFFLNRLSRMTTRNQAVLRRLAYVDPLTGHRNYNKFVVDAEDLLHGTNSTSYALWYADIKKFKYFNDLYGYELGDTLLQELAEMLAAQETRDAFFCRVSADCFAGIRPYKEKEDLSTWFEKLSHDLSHMEVSQANHLHIEMSMGIYCLTEEEKAADVAVIDLVNRANMAHKIAKSRTGSQCEFYTSHLREEMKRETEMENWMADALKAGDFTLYMHPKVDIQHSNRLLGAELLVRWQTRGQGMIYPGAFIPLFERNGFIVQLDRFLFRQICIWLRGYLDDGRQPVGVAVNVSRISLMQEDFISFYTNTKREYGIPDDVLELEFSESVIWSDSEFFRVTVLQLQANGFTCSLDDFGTGYSSLNVLKNLPIDVLKMDIAFFREGVDISRERIVIESIIAMAKELHIRTVAEGVETSDQVDFLREVGCDIIQGYVFAKPMPLEAFDQLLRLQGEKPMAPKNV